MIDAAVAAETYVSRKCGPPASSDNCERIAWQDGDLFDAFLAGSVWAASAVLAHSNNSFPVAERIRELAP